MNELQDLLTQLSSTSTAAEPAWVEYIPALIGLLGVLVGGMITIAAQRHHFNEEQVAIIRERVAEFCIIVQEMTTSAKQARDTLEKHGESTSDLGIISLDAQGKKLFAVVGTQFHELIRRANALSIKLMSARDRKIADHLGTVHHELSSYQLNCQTLFEYKLTISKDALDAECKRIILICNELLTMIEPRRFETFLRIKSVEGARKTICKQSGQKADQKAQTK